jgi:ectoine hydroxylase-related dioxygenase (phytanoyl-CoA dioxygenase family)
VPKSRDQNGPPPPSAQSSDPPGAEQLIAPAGSVLIFDIRTWHRSYWNRSGSDRCAILNNVLPQWVMPMMDQSKEYTEFVSSGLADAALTPRERQDADMLMQNIVQGKPIQTFQPPAKL